MKSSFNGIKLGLSQLRKKDSTIIPLTLVQSFLSGAKTYIRLIFMARIIDLILVKNLKNAFFLIIAMLIVDFFVSFFKDLSKDTILLKAEIVQYKMKVNIQDKVMKIKYSEFDKPDILKKLSDANYTMEHTGGYYSYVEYLRELLENLISIAISIGLIIYMCMQHTKVDNKFFDFINNPIVSSLIVGILIGVSFMVSKNIEKSVKKYDMDTFNEKMGAERKLNYYIDNIFLKNSAQKDIRMFDMYGFLNEKFTNILNDVDDFINEFYFVKDENRQISNLVLSFFSSIFVYAVVIIKTYTKSISIGAMTQSVSALINVNKAMSSLSNCLKHLELQNEYILYYDNLLRVKEDKNEGRNIEKFPVIEFKNVSFKYPNAIEYTLKNINMVIDENSKMAIVGKNGSGKTTFIKLLIGLYDATEGEILVDGINRNEFNIIEYRRIFSVVFQDFKIFPVSIKENIIGSEKFDEKKLLRITEELNLNVINKSILDTELLSADEDSVSFSGGQLQKLAIARAIYQDREIIILDEPTASLDPISEEEVYRDMLNMSKSKPIIFISHRMSSCRSVNDILVLDNGEVVERGNHKDLLKKEGLYYSLFNAQKNYYN